MKQENKILITLFVIGMVLVAMYSYGQVFNTPTIIYQNDNLHQLPSYMVTEKGDTLIPIVDHSLEIRSNMPAIGPLQTYKWVDKHEYEQSQPFVLTRKQYYDILNRLGELERRPHLGNNIDPVILRKQKN